MRNFFLGLILASILVSVGFWIVSKQNALQNQPAPQAAAQKYHCPMHPDYISDKPGDCPICGMKLVPIEGTGASAQAERKILYYTDAMNPGSRYDKPGKAPDGMDLVPVYAEEAPGGPSPVVPGYAAIKIKPEREQSMGIITTEARVMDLNQSIRAVGIVTADETRLHHIHTKFEGYIEEIFVDYIGQYVRQGQPLFTLYSPELLAAQKEYLLALRARDQLGNLASDSPLPGINLVESARQRLALWDINPDQIAQIEKTREPVRALTIYAPVSGYVTAKTAVQGNRVMPADSVYDIIDLSTVWVIADIYEVNVPFVKVGDPVSVSLSYQPGSVIKGRVSYINLALDEKSRTVKARIELPNPAGLLKPDMYADVDLGGQLGRGIAVPDNAVMGTGEREIVFVAKGNGLYEPREVKTGVKVRGYYEIKSGVAAGERVVTGANFLLDSESRLKAAISGAAGGGR
jgi:Cu(I)/Ag(I) efflux system membrane fusion protein